MNNEAWLKGATKKLEAAGIATARLDCLILLEDITGKDRSWLLAHPEFELTYTQVKKLDGFIKRRAEHEPLAYLRNKTEFYGREFYIDHSVLEPRPESETMIELLKKVLGSRLEVLEKTKIVDVGTGSGALAITAKLELSEAKVLATDIDENCLEIARKNAKKLKAEVDFIKGDLLDPLGGLKLEPLVLLCNLPYVPDSFQINPAAMAEPRVAIFGGSDGLDLYRKLFAQIKDLQNKPGYILTESMPPQHKHLEQIAQAAGYRMQATNDFIQLYVD